jgi:hypothetical protein
MPILSKGSTFATGNQVTAANLNALVDSATFAAGAVDTITTELSSGAIAVKNGGITPSKLSSYAPTWGLETVDGVPNLQVMRYAGNAVIQGSVTTGGAIASSNSITASGDLATNGDLRMVNTKQIIPSGSPGRTIALSSGTGGNAIQFGFSNDENGTFLLVTIDGSSEYKIALTSV